MRSRLAQSEPNPGFRLEVCALQRPDLRTRTDPDGCEEPAARCRGTSGFCALWQGRGLRRSVLFTGQTPSPTVVPTLSQAVQRK